MARDPACSEAHARLERATGRAPAAAPAELDAALRIAVSHPYDPRALLDAGKRAAEAGRLDLATSLLEKVIWLGDLDPGSTADALALLPQVDPRQPRRAVPVHVFADAALRAQEGWRFRLRTRWAEVSATLERVLGARVVVLAIEPFEAHAGGEVASALAALAAAPAPEYGIVAGMLEVPEPLDAGKAGVLDSSRDAAPAGVLDPSRDAAPAGVLDPSRDAAPAGLLDPHRGAAEFLGRRLVARLEPGEAGGRLLAHEILHLYGAVHTPAGSQSLMNATGDSRVLDAANRRIVALTRERIFGPGGVDRNVLPGLDLAAAIDAWGSALRLDLALRGSELSRAVAASALVPEATGPDPHMGDVAHWVAALLVAEGRRDEAALLLETASALHGPRTPEGRAEAERARALRGVPD